MRRGHKIAIVLIVITAITGWWLYTRPRWQPVLTNPLIEKIKIDGKRVRVRLADTSRIDEIVDLFPFHGLRPLSGFKNARQVLGEPDNRIKKGEYFMAYEYWYPEGRVDLEFQESSMSSTWYLCAYPASVFFVEILADEISSVIDGSQEETIVVLDGQDNVLVMLVIIHGLRVESIHWPYREGTEQNEQAEDGTD